MKFINKILFLLVNLIYFMYNAEPPVPPAGGPPGGGAGGTTSGAPASPIDNYIVYLAAIALFVIYYTYKKSNRLVNN